MAIKFHDLIMRTSLKKRKEAKRFRFDEEKRRFENMSNETLLFYYVELKSSYENKKNVFSFILATVLAAGISNIWTLLAYFAKMAFGAIYEVCTTDDILALLTVGCVLCICISAAIIVLLMRFLKSMHTTHRSLLIVEEIRTKRNRGKNYGKEMGNS